MWYARQSAVNQLHVHAAGHVNSREDLEYIAELCVRHNVYVLSDEGAHLAFCAPLGFGLVHCKAVMLNILISSGCLQRVRIRLSHQASEKL